MKRALSFLAFAMCITTYGQYFQEQDVFSGEFLEPYEFQTFDGHLYYTGVNDEDEFSTVMYRTNGTVGNIAKQLDANGGVFEVSIILGEFDGSLYFYGFAPDQPGELWRVSGANESPVQVTNINNSDIGDLIVLRTMREINGILLFDLDVSNGDNTGKEIWTTDGTPEGTHILLDINPNGDGFYTWLGELNNALYFAADNGTDGYELWRTDGTASGTYMVKDINPSGDGVSGEGLVYNGKLYFQGATQTNGRELWITDGTPEGTQLFIDLNEGFGDGPDYDPEFTIFNERLYFVANDGETGNELWATDGTVEGTAQVVDLAEGPTDAVLLNFSIYNERIYFGFNASGSGNPRRLWATDGTEEGTVLIAPDAPIDNPRDMFQVDNELIFLTNNADTGIRELWRTDGTDEGTYEIKPEGLEDQWNIQGFGHFAVFGGRMFLDAELNGDADLWTYGANDITLTTDSFEEEYALTVYPNPAKDILWISSEVPLKTMRLFSLDGRLIRSEQLNGATQFPMITSDIKSSGLYLLELQSETKRVVVKVEVAP